MRKVFILLGLVVLIVLGTLLAYKSSSNITSKNSVKDLSPKHLAIITKAPSKIKTVFIIVMENKNREDIYKNPSAPYINGLLQRADASFATNYYGVTHPSEPNYIWLEAGDNKNLPDGRSTVSFTTDADPSSSNSSSTHDHLTSYLEKQNISFKTYAEGIDGKTCPLVSNGQTLYAAKHTPMVFFQDLTNNNNPYSKSCISHIRPLSELFSDLKTQVPQYNFIVPNLCHDMHNSSGCDTTNSIKNGDTWLSEVLPQILASKEYRDNGAIFITADESEGLIIDKPVGLILLSPDAKGHGYNNNVFYNHSSLLKTVQEIFGVYPLLRNASQATDLSSLFKNGYIP